MTTVSAESFEAMNLCPLLLENIQSANYRKPTPIQKAVCPVLLNGQDLMACAQSGSGRTVNYLLSDFKLSPNNIICI